MSSNAVNAQKVQALLSNAEKHLHRMFLAGCIFGALSCFGRADYNLPMYAFLYIMWDQDDVSYLSNRRASAFGFYAGSENHDNDQV